MPNKATRYHVKFNVLLDETDDMKLIALAKRDDTSKARLCRTLIRASYAMKFESTPKCADAGACRCPHAHQYSPPLSIPPDPDRHL